MKYYAKKHIETTYEEGIELIKSEYKLIDFDTEDLEMFEDKFGTDTTNDYEESYANGIAYAWDDVYYYDVDKLIDSISSKISQIEEEEDSDDNLEYDWFTNILRVLRRYEGYDIYAEIPDKLKPKEE